MEMAPGPEVCGLGAGSSRAEPPHRPLELEFGVWVFEASVLLQPPAGPLHPPKWALGYPPPHHRALSDPLPPSMPPSLSCCHGAGSAVRGGEEAERGVEGEGGGGKEQGRLGSLGAVGQ